LIALALFNACAKHDAPPLIEAGAAPQKNLRIVDGGPLPDGRVACDDVECPEPRGSDPLDEIACCLPSGGCGIRSPLLGDRCLQPKQRGSVDLNCASFSTPRGDTAQGCCSESGRCGFFDRYGDLGCVVVDHTDGGARCTYDPDSICRSIVPLLCDGPEDCNAEGVCCGRSNASLFDAIGCFASCAVAENIDRSVWRELCHTDTDCRNPLDWCISVGSLPGAYRACYPRGPVPSTFASSDASGPDASGPADASIRDADLGGMSDADAQPDPNIGIACGAMSCELGETCCVRDQGQPYCLSRGERCTCAVPAPHDAGGTAGSRDE
jgi:hypothetical protein